MTRNLYNSLFLIIIFLSIFSCNSLDIVETDSHFIEEKMVYLNGFNHYIDIRGRDRENPVLLIIHGGPGWTVDSITKYVFKELEKDFTVVNWHQRGAGRSRTSDVSLDKMNLDVFLDDTLHVINYLREEFDQDKIVLLGHSWGSILGSITSKTHPELIHAYIGVSQMTNTKKMINSSVLKAINVALSKGEKSSAVYLKNVNFSYSNPEWAKDVIKFRDLLTELGGTIYGYTQYTPLLKYYFKDSDYRLWEMFTIYKGIEDSVINLFPVMLEANVYSKIDSLEIPYFLIQGKHDMLTREHHSLNFYEKIDSPLKKYYLFENSAHSPYFEEPERFISIMLEEIKPLCDNIRYVRKEYEVK